MTFHILPIEQRSPAWYQARLGRLTSSRAADMLATRRDKTEAAGRRNLRIQLALERLTGRSHEPSFQSAAMLAGQEREAAAAAAYEAVTGRVLTFTGFCSADHLLTGCSLDGHVATNGGAIEGIIEIKCPLAATHLDSLKTATIPREYLSQMCHAFWVTGAAWGDWMSYHESFPDSLRAKIVRIERETLDLAAYEAVALAFLAEVEAELDAIQHLMPTTGGSHAESLRASAHHCRT